MAQHFQKKKRLPEVDQTRRVDISKIFSAKPNPLNGKLILRALVIAAAGFWVFSPAFQGNWIWDDGWYIATNPLLHNMTGLWKFWFQPGSWVEYYPLEETVQWMQWRLWDNDTLGYHLTNVFLHVVNALLVWRLLNKFGLHLAWLGGLLFAVHPAQVESVAYISELKNTLSLPFFLLASCFWIDYEKHRQKRDYQWALGLFLAGMLCKITLAPFPVLILLYAWWKRGRIDGKDLKASAPFFVISLVLGYMTIWAGQHYEEMGHARPYLVSLGGFFSRLVLAEETLAFYFSRSFLPIDYLPAYPKWQVNPYSPINYLPWLIVTGCLCWLWKKRRGWGRHALLGLGFFFLTLAPFLGFVAISYMSFTWVMDHFLYLPLIGLIGLVVAGLGDLEARFPTDRPYVMGGVTIVIALMAMESHALSGLFVHDEVLWRYTLQRNPTCWLAHENLGSDLIDQERFPEAIAQYQEVLLLNPDYSDGHYNMGVALEKIGQVTAAQEQYRQALRLDPGNGKAYMNLAGGLLKTGNVTEALAQFAKAVEFLPDLAQLRYDWGSALLRTGNFPAAIEQLNIAVKLDPQMAQAHENLGSALAQSGRLSEAIEQFEAALQINPAYAAARDNLGLALAQSGHIPEAVEQFRQALQLNPDDALARQNLARLQELKMRSGKN